MGSRSADNLSSLSLLRFLEWKEIPNFEDKCSLSCTLHPH